MKIEADAIPVDSKPLELMAWFVEHGRSFRYRVRDFRSLGDSEPYYIGEIDPDAQKIRIDGKAYYV